MAGFSDRNHPGPGHGPRRASGTPSGERDGAFAEHRPGPSRSSLLAALAVCAVLGALQLALAGIPDLVRPPGRLMTLWPQTLAWLGMGALWIIGSRRIFLFLRRSSTSRGVFQDTESLPSLDEDHRHLTAALWFGVSAVLCAVILPPMLIGQWTLQPVQLWQGLYSTYGMAGVMAAVGWLAYHCGFSILAALTLATVQALTESVVSSRWASVVPVGGIVVGLMGGLLQALTGGPAAFVTTLISCTLLGAVHLLTGRRLRWTAPATALVLIFL